MFARVRKRHVDVVNFVGAVYEGNGATLRELADRLSMSYWNLNKRASRLVRRSSRLVTVSKVKGRNVYLQTRPGLTPHQARQIQKNRDEA